LTHFIFDSKTPSIVTVTKNLWKIADSRALVRAKGLNRLVVTFQNSNGQRKINDEEGAVFALQHLAWDLGSTVTELSINGLACWPYHPSLFLDLSGVCEMFSSVKKLIVRFCQSPSPFALPLISKFRKVTHLEVRVWGESHFSNADEITFQLLVNLPSLIELILGGARLCYVPYFAYESNQYSSLFRQGGKAANNLYCNTCAILHQFLE
jgi:hypothetical protein